MFEAHTYLCGPSSPSPPKIEKKALRNFVGKEFRLLAERARAGRSSTKLREIFYAGLLQEVFYVLDKDFFCPRAYIPLGDVKIFVYKDRNRDSPYRGV